MIKIDLNYFTLKESNIPGLELDRRGKVRDIYQLDDGNLCIVATDRISTHDKVYKQQIPHKGYGLTQTPVFVFKETENIMPNHLIGSPDPNVMIVMPAEVYPLEVVVRAILTGSAWKEYVKTGGDVWGHKLPKGMKKNQRLDKLIVTPTTKAEGGEHDLPLTEAQARDLVGPIYDEMRSNALIMFERGKKLAAKRGAMPADTKLEFGKNPKYDLLLVDELLTHDSSRYLYIKNYEEAFAAGEEPDWIDKQLVRNYAESVGFFGEGEPPQLPDHIIKGATERVLKVYRMLTGEDLPLPPEPPTDERIGGNLRAAGLIG
jgi:phosphoribosylaminoimidazole-succinocarboxamide synthase